MKKRGKNATETDCTLNYVLTQHEHCKQDYSNQCVQNGRSILSIQLFLVKHMLKGMYPYKVGGEVSVA